MIATAAQSSLVFASAPVRQDSAELAVVGGAALPRQLVSNPPSEEPDDEPPPENIWINTKATTASSPRPPPPAATPPSPPSPPPARAAARATAILHLAGVQPGSFVELHLRLPMARPLRARPRCSHLRPLGTPVPPDRRSRSPRGVRSSPVASAGRRCTGTPRSQSRTPCQRIRATVRTVTKGTRSEGAQHAHRRDGPAGAGERGHERGACRPAGARCSPTAPAPGGGVRIR